jgi:DNA-binding NarL/FixJ family response regulator
MPLVEPGLNGKTLRILVADDHELVRRGVRALLENQPGWQVIAEAENGREVIERVQQLQPDVVIVDISMPEMDGLSAVARLRELQADVQALVLTYHDSPQMVRKAFDTGARAYVLKPDAGLDLIAAVNAVREHKLFVSPRISRELRQEYDPTRS